MQFGYTWLRTFALGHVPQLLLGIGLIALPLALRLEKTEFAAIPRPVAPRAPHVSATRTDRDVRTVRLRKFLLQLHCPVQDLAADFIRAADANHLDWRLLPSISVIESGGGKAYRNNNIFGWNNGEQSFFSIRDSIPVIASKLGRSPLYRNRDVAGKLRVYNPNETYAESVMAVMNRMGPAYAAKGRRDITND